MNAFRFFTQNIIRVAAEDNVNLRFDDKLSGLTTLEASEWNVMDRWVVSSVQSLIAWFRKEMAAYHLYNVTPYLVRFIGQLTNWYVRLNRRRFKVSCNAKSY